MVILLPWVLQHNVFENYLQLKEKSVHEFTSVDASCRNDVADTIGFIIRET